MHARMQTHHILVRIMHGDRTVFQLCSLPPDARAVCVALRTDTQIPRPVDLVKRIYIVVVAAGAVLLGYVAIHSHLYLLGGKLSALWLYGTSIAYGQSVLCLCLCGRVVGISRHHSVNIMLLYTIYVCSSMCLEYRIFAIRSTIPVSRGVVPSMMCVHFYVVATPSDWPKRGVS